MDPLHAAIALFPVAMYLLIIGAINLSPRPFVTTGARDAMAQANLPIPTPRPNWNDWMIQRVLSEVYSASVDVVVADERVIEELGDPVETDVNAAELFVRVNEGNLDAKGEAIEFEVLGPQGRGTVRVTATGAGDFGRNGPIQVQEITVTLDDGTTIDVEPPPERTVQVR